MHTSAYRVPGHGESSTRGPVQRRPGLLRSRPLGSSRKATCCLRPPLGASDTRPSVPLHATGLGRTDTQPSVPRHAAWLGWAAHTRPAQDAGCQLPWRRRHAGSPPGAARGTSRLLRLPLAFALGEMPGPLRSRFLRRRWSRPPGPWRTLRSCSALWEISAGVKSQTNPRSARPSRYSGSLGTGGTGWRAGLAASPKAEMRLLTQMSRCYGRLLLWQHLIKRDAAFAGGLHLD